MALTKLQAAGVLQSICLNFEIKEDEKLALEMGARALCHDPDEVAKAVEDFKKEIRTTIFDAYFECSGGPKTEEELGKAKMLIDVLSFLEREWEEGGEGK